jgi:CHAT domain-containing protein
LASGAVDFRAGVDATLLERERELSAEITSLRTQFTNLRNQPQSESNLNLIAAMEVELAEREADYAHLLIEIKTESPEVAGLVSIDVASLAEVQTLLDSRTTLIEYFVTRDRTLAFVITRDTFDTATIDVSRDELAKTISAFRDFPGLNNPYPASLGQLYDWLIAPLKDRIQTPAVGIIPHGLLHYLPFAALTHQAQYLDDDYVLFTLPSASVRIIQDKRWKSGPGN